MEAAHILPVGALGSTDATSNAVIRANASPAMKPHVRLMLRE